MFIRDLETDSQIEKYKSFTDNIRKNDTQAGIQIWGLFITLAIWRSIRKWKDDDNGRPSY